MSQDSKQIMAKNLAYYMVRDGKTRNDLCSDLGIKYSTVRDWLKGLSYPRIDAIEMLVEYFGITKADLVEERPSHAQTDKTKELLDYCGKLNDSGIEAIIGFAKVISENPQFTK